MKLRQFREYSMRSIFLIKSYTKGGEETSPATFSKKLKLSRSLDLNINTVCFYCLLLFFAYIVKNAILKRIPA